MSTAERGREMPAEEGVGTELGQGMETGCVAEARCLADATGRGIRRATGFALPDFMNSVCSRPRADGIHSYCRYDRWPHDPDLSSFCPCSIAKAG